MGEKINVAELLKDCTKGMELDCTMWDNVKFSHIDMTRDYPIYITIEGNTEEQLTKYGQWSHNPNSKCVIFPKCKTTWEGFVPPCKFKNGDIVTNMLGAVAIYKEITTCGYCGSFASLDHYNQFIPHYQSYLKDCIRLSTEEEKEKLFDAIKANGYRWNAETKTLEKLIEPKFKVGDKIRHKTTNKDDIYKISKVYDDSYGLVDFTWMIYMKYQDQYELVPNKFDITTLKPFESRVLVRDRNNDEWRGQFFSHYNNCSDIPYICIGNEGLSEYKQCIPYKCNEYLLGKTDDCDEYYKTWK